MKHNPFYLEDNGGMNYVIHRAAVKKSNQHSILICGPAPYEFFRSHWARTQIAQRLAKLGYDTYCFDYPCTGDSDGASQDYSIENSLQSLLYLTQYVKTQENTKNISLLGLRLGANLALRASAELNIHSLFMVDPILDGAVYLEQLHRMQHGLLHDNLYLPPFADASRGHQEALGYPLVQPALDELNQLTFEVNETRAQNLIFLSSSSEGEQLKEHMDQPFLKDKECLYLEAPNEFHWRDWRYSNMQIMPINFLKIVEKHFSGVKP